MSTPPRSAITPTSTSSEWSPNPHGLKGIQGLGMVSRRDRRKAAVAAAIGEVLRMTLRMPNWHCRWFIGAPMPIAQLAFHHWASSQLTVTGGSYCTLVSCRQSSTCLSSM